MKKVSTLFKKDPHNLGRVINEVNPENTWVMDGHAIATRKFDGTAASIIDGVLYKRYDVRKGKQPPLDAIPCQEPDALSGHWPHWMKCDRVRPEDKFFFEGFDNLPEKIDGTYELVGPKVQGNPEKFEKHMLVRHGSVTVEVPALDFYALRDWLAMEANDIEGVVFHHKSDCRMCKIRKSDFGIRRFRK